MAREKTSDEIRNEFLTHVSGLITYWNEQGTSQKDALEGLAFSILAMLDGTSVLPEFIVAPLITDEDRAFMDEEGDNYYPVNDPDSIKGNIVGSLHELIGRYQS